MAAGSPQRALVLGRRSPAGREVRAADLGAALGVGLREAGATVVRAVAEHTVLAGSSAAPSDRGLTLRARDAAPAGLRSVVGPEQASAAVGAVGSNERLASGGDEATCVEQSMELLVRVWWRPVATESAQPWLPVPQLNA